MKCGCNHWEQLNFSHISVLKVKVFQRKAASPLMTLLFSNLYFSNSRLRDIYEKTKQKNNHDEKYRATHWNTGARAALISCKAKLLFSSSDSGGFKESNTIILVPCWTGLKISYTVCTYTRFFLFLEGPTSVSLLTPSTTISFQTGDCLTTIYFS